MVIALVALIVIGPERLPKVARTLGALLGRAQRYVNDVKSDIQREVNLDELKDLKSTFQDAAKSVQESVSEVGKDLQATQESLNQSVSGAGNHARSRRRAAVRKRNQRRFAATGSGAG